MALMYLALLAVTKASAPNAMAATAQLHGTSEAQSRAQDATLMPAAAAKMSLQHRQPARSCARRSRFSHQGNAAKIMHSQSPHRCACWSRPRPPVHGCTRTHSRSRLNQHKQTGVCLPCLGPLSCVCRCHRVHQGLRQECLAGRKYGSVRRFNLSWQATTRVMLTARCSFCVVRICVLAMPWHETAEEPT